MAKSRRTRRSWTAALALVFGAVLVFPAAADGDEVARRGSSRESPYVVQRATSEITVDGVLDEQAWKDALEVPLEYESFPGDGIMPPVRTEALLTFDDRFVYVAFRCHDPEPEKIRAHLMDRDQVATFVQDDHVVVQFDTFDENRRAFQLRVNPFGVQMDALFGETGGFEDFAWDIIWTSAGKSNSDGYTVELAVPVNQIRFPKQNGPQTWGVELSRSYPRNVRYRMSAHYRDRDNSCVLCQIDRVSGWDGLSPGINLEVNPTLTGLSLEEINDAGELETTDEAVDLGVTTRWGVTTNTRLGATLNPDFSDVEADVAQIRVNRTFALFFPEQRPFFLEGIDTFRTRQDVVFTRTVVDPKWGLKFSGKQGRNDFGIFASEDRANAFLIPGNQGSVSEELDESTLSGVVRYRRDVGKASTVGGIYTDRSGEGDYRNRVAGLDGFLRFDKKNTMTLEFFRSETRYPTELQPADPADPGPCPDGTLECEGDSFLLDWDYSSRNWFGSIFYLDREPGFRADMGFIPRVDIKDLQGVAVRTFWAPEDAWYQQWQVGLSGYRTQNHAGELTNSGADLFANFTGPLQSFVEVSLGDNQQLFEGVLYDDMQRAQVFGVFQPTGSVRFDVFTDLGDSIDFTNNQPADTFLIRPRLELRLGRHVNLQLRHTHQTLDVNAGRLFTVDLSQVRFVYQLTVRAFARAIVQYQDLRQDPALYTTLDPADRPPPRTQDLFVQLLLSYRLNARTVFFIGYTEGQEGADTIDPVARELFMKASYAWLF